VNRTNSSIYYTTHLTM